MNITFNAIGKISFTNAWSNLLEQGINYTFMSENKKSLIKCPTISV